MASTASRTVFVTGANKGIGLAVVRRCLLHADNVRCVLACRSKERGEAARKSLISENASWGPRTFVLEMDQGSDTSVKSAEASWQAHGFANSDGDTTLYAIVNNAGIAIGSVADVLNVNVRGVKRVCDAFIKHVNKEDGRVTMMSSGAGPGSVTKCSEERQRFFVRDDVEWKDIQGVMEEAEGLEKEGRKLEDVGLSGLIAGAYGLSK